MTGHLSEQFLQAVEVLPEVFGRDVALLTGLLERFAPGVPGGRDLAAADAFLGFRRVIDGGHPLAFALRPLLEVHVNSLLRRPRPPDVIGPCGLQRAGHLGTRTPTVPP